MKPESREAGRATGCAAGRETGRREGRTKRPAGVRLWRPVLWLWASLFPVSAAFAQQDSPLSANFDLPVLSNPARAGLGGETFYDYGSDHTFNLNYKSQMNGVFSNYAIRVLSASYNALLLDRTMSVGLDVYTNTLNNAAVSDFSMHLTYAYHLVVAKDPGDNPSHRLSFGLQAGFRRWAVNLDRLQTGGMYDPAYSGGLNPSLSPVYDFDETARTTFDIQVGVHYTGWVMPNLRVQGGLSGYHLNRGETGLGYVSQRTPVKLGVYGGAAWHDKDIPAPSAKRGSHFEIEPELMANEVSGTVTFMNQGAYNVLEIAAMYRLYLCGDLAVGAGLAYRTLSQANVFSPVLSLDINGFTLNIQCDLNAGTGSAFTNIFALGLGYRF